ncbi:Znfx1 [Symbiodinium pilosum]|uniref:Znfx1 protein n=1 Tax=Symbiodinium pilosum TaxID=2952 RepID=A0A812JNI4_SYMPI|nr:Znfx1 [Symbiodinium pilosum]
MQDLPEVSWDYKSVEDYMSTYFRLLRADCFGALQKGVMDFIRGTLDKRDLRVLRAEAVEFSVVRGIKGLTAYLECENIFDFAVPFPPRVLMQSNLVCLSIGLKPFSEVLWARVAERPTDPKAQKQAKIRVGLEFLDYQNHGFPLQSIMTRLMSPSSLLLADSPVFFLSFGPVLKRLQSMSDGQDSLPQGTLLLGRSFLSLQTSIQQKERSFDPSQESALRVIFSSKISCIQGPGTGKSFIGVEAIRHILSAASRHFQQIPARDLGPCPDPFSDHLDSDTNACVEYEADPRRTKKVRILVMAFKNHALDECLLDVMKNCPGASVVRIGGRCEDERLKSRTLQSFLDPQVPWFSLTRDAEKDINLRKMLRDQACLSKLAERIPSLQLFVNNVEDALCNGEQISDSAFKVCFHGWLPKARSQAQVEPAKASRNQTSAVEESSDVEAEDEAKERQAFQERVEKWSLDDGQRASLLGFWLQKEVDNLWPELVKLLQRNDELQEHIMQLENQHAINILSGADVVGCTISGASIKGDLLAQVDFPVVVVEEAAEILEPQLLAALPQRCQQIIMIGDHFQLQPKIQNHLLGRERNFDRSMMERLLASEVADYPKAMLQKQNRMRDEFLLLLHPFYPDLSTNLERVKGHRPLSCCEKSMFFVTMRELTETEAPERRSPTNPAEAETILKFAAHIVREGYNAEDITILAMYDGQVSLLRKMLRDRQGLADIQCSSVDRFQGDENKFVLISVVRSNREGKAGFVSERNRLIVALSRARCGVYFFGNDQLLEKKSKEWRQVLQALTNRGCAGPELPIVCPRHPSVRLQLGQDCHHSCEVELECGHTCGSPCHQLNKHPACTQEITVKLLCGHDKVCKCFQRQQGIENLKCTKTVEFQHDICNHWDTRKCCDKKKQCQTMV